MNLLLKKSFHLDIERVLTLFIVCLLFVKYSVFLLRFDAFVRHYLYHSEGKLIRYKEVLFRNSVVKNIMKDDFEEVMKDI